MAGNTLCSAWQCLERVKHFGGGVWCVCVCVCVCMRDTNRLLTFRSLAPHDVPSLSERCLDNILAKFIGGGGCSGGWKRLEEVGYAWVSGVKVFI